MAQRNMNSDKCQWSFWGAADIAKAQERLGRANVSTTRLYGRWKTRPEDNPTFKVTYEKGTS